MAKDRILRKTNEVLEKNKNRNKKKTKKNTWSYVKDTSFVYFFFIFCTHSTFSCILWLPCERQDSKQEKFSVKSSLIFKSLNLESYGCEFESHLLIITISYENESKQLKLFW